MNGIKKAAIFLSGLDCSEADQLLSRLDGESAKLIRREMFKHHEVSVEETQRLGEEFLNDAGWKPAPSIREHQFSTPKSSVHSQPKRQAMKYNTEAFVPPVRSFDFMQNWSVNDVVEAIIDEHPQTIAVVLAHLPLSKMRSVLHAFPNGLRKDVQSRLDEYQMPNEQVVQEIESALKMRYRKQRRTVTYPTRLESFDDIATLNDSELAILFRSVDLTTAMLALIGLGPTLIARITKHFSPTEEHEMRKRLKRLDCVDEEDIERARHSILEQYNATV